MSVTSFMPMPITSLVNLLPGPCTPDISPSQALRPLTLQPSPATTYFESVTALAWQDEFFSVFCWLSFSALICTFSSALTCVFSSGGEEEELKGTAIEADDDSRSPRQSHPAPDITGQDDCCGNHMRIDLSAHNRHPAHRPWRYRPPVPHLQMCREPNPIGGCAGTPLSPPVQVRGYWQMAKGCKFLRTG